MAGLLGDVLPYVYSRGNMLQRRLNSLLADPVGTAQQAMGQAGDSMNRLAGLLDQTFADPRSYQPTNRNKLAELVGELQSGPLGFAPVGITAWHGSPHTFDKFDSSKIGSGEGAQAYGHGLYLAENPETAAFYRQKLTADQTLGSYKERLEARARALKKTADLVEKTDPERAARLRTDAASYTPEGALYKVDLPDSAVAKMLDWDKPLSQQPEAVRAAAQRIPGMEYANKYFAANRKADPTGADLHEFLRLSGYDPTQIAPMFTKAGVPGIRYLDGGSRGAGAGSSNFVVFPGEENVLSILERNGQALK